MNVRDALRSFRGFCAEFARVKSGIAGLAILLSFIVLAVIGPAVVPFPGAVDHWRDIDFWQDNPPVSPPEWVNALPWTGKKGAASSVLTDFRLTEEQSEDGIALRKYVFPYVYAFDRPPRDIIIRFHGQGQVIIDITMTRPDGLTADLHRQQLEMADGILERVSVERNCAQAVIEFVRGADAETASKLNADSVKPVRILFSRIDPEIAENPAALKGGYSIALSVLCLNAGSRIEDPSIVVSGHVSGLLGTDMAKRDVFTGIIIGIRWALFIGILTSVLTVLAGVLLGVIAAYFGGIVDMVLTRLYEFVYLMPVLPFLIVISAVFKPSIWTLIAIICLFFWSGPYKPVYSMALQIKEETFVEASRALGSTRFRIILRHIVPLLLPYSFAVMALSIPAVIVYEASISLLGLGDATIVTWGQILHDAFYQGAVINNLWWWVVPPGLMIALMGMSFAFIGTAMDKILHPRLKTR